MLGIRTFQRSSILFKRSSLLIPRCTLTIATRKFSCSNVQKHRRNDPFDDPFIRDFMKQMKRNPYYRPPPMYRPSFWARPGFWILFSMMWIPFMFPAMFLIAPIGIGCMLLWSRFGYSSFRNQTSRASEHLANSTLEFSVNPATFMEDVHVATQERMVQAIENDEQGFAKMFDVEPSEAMDRVRVGRATSVMSLQELGPQGEPMVIQLMDMSLLVDNQPVAKLKVAYRGKFDLIESTQECPASITVKPGYSFVDYVVNTGTKSQFKVSRGPRGERIYTYKQ